MTDRSQWHDLRESPDDLPKESISVLTLSSDDSLDECVYIPNEGFKDPVFSTWYYPVAWIEKEKILPNTQLKADKERLAELLSLCKYLYAHRGQVFFTDEEMDEKYYYDGLARELLGE